MKKPRPQEWSAAHLAELVRLALESDTYTPTLSSPEQVRMADAFDAAMAEHGSSKRAWRGITPAVRVAKRKDVGP